MRMNDRRTAGIPACDARPGMAAVLVGGFLWFLCSVASAEAHTTPPSWQDKVDPGVISAALASKEWQTEFLVVMQEQADLGKASFILDKNEKGRYVFEQLRAVALRTQGPVLAQLQQQAIAFHPFWIENMIWTRGDLLLVQQLAERADVRRISANPHVMLRLPQPSARELSATKAVEWNITKTRASELWSLGITGEGVVIGGQDTGYDWDHPALINQYRGWNGVTADHNYNWHDAIHSGGGSCGSNSLVPCDDGQHGTHTMGTMVGDDGAANQIGMAPGARWIGCRNMDRGNGTPATYTECFQWFLAPTDLNGQNPDPSKAPDVINNSWGCPASEGCTDPNVLKTIVENVRAAGIVVVVSAGNSGSNCSSVSDPPSIYEASFTVGNTTSSDVISSDSSRGPVTADGSGRLKPDLCAPGTGIRSSVPGTGYQNMSGTSMAGPHVAGLVALILQAHPGLRGQVDRIEHLIEQTAVRRTTAQVCGGVAGTNIPNNTYGWGRIDAVEAVGITEYNGLPGWWSMLFDLGPTNSLDVHADPDGDGMSSLQEFVANTNPTNRDSVLKLSSVTLTATGSVSLVWNSRQDGYDVERTYNLYRSRRLDEGGWETVATNLSSQGDFSAWMGAESDVTSTWFYCVAAVRQTNEVWSQPLQAPRASNN
jgi:serine protease AprX